MTLAVDQLEAHAALLELIKVVQAESFAIDLANMNHQRRISKELRKFAPFIDEHGVLRVGGRLVCSSLPYEAKHPALIPNRHRLTDLLIERTHKENLSSRTARATILDYPAFLDLRSAARY